MTTKHGRRWVRLSSLLNRCRRCNQIIPADRYFCQGCRAFLIQEGLYL